MEKENGAEEVLEFPGDKGEVPVAMYNLAIDDASVEEDGSWKVVRTVKHVVTFDKKHWFVREKSIMSIDKDFTHANLTTQKAMSNFLQSYDGDFFSKGEWNDHQYVMINDNKNEVAIEEHHGTVESV